MGQRCNGKIVTEYDRHASSSWHSSRTSSCYFQQHGEIERNLFQRKIAIGAPYWGSIPWFSRIRRIQLYLCRISTVHSHIPMPTNASYAYVKRGLLIVRHDQSPDLTHSKSNIKIFHYGAFPANWNYSHQYSKKTVQFATKQTSNHQHHQRSHYALVCTVCMSPNSSDCYQSVVSSRKQRKHNRYLLTGFCPHHHHYSILHTRTWIVIKSNKMFSFFFCILFSFWMHCLHKECLIDTLTLRCCVVNVNVYTRTAYKYEWPINWLSAVGRGISWRDVDAITRKSISLSLQKYQQQQIIPCRDWFNSKVNSEY